ncbi:OprO/OprP family phosphate-selective porin [Frateuria sp. STR12]|uniref:OprO/OprP family phosphate-selective porin n=1 Tax=Frateuria hangzhouensis TaxID=2995589 RepID=UPI0022608E57|nr:porin [Frateuria sp. STR12]MCX7514377.1 porin [Frateuria sp. STR12]
MRMPILTIAMAAWAPLTPVLADDATPWPTSVTSDSGVTVGVKGLFQYDINRFADDRLPDGSERFEDAHALRRQEINLYVTKKGVFTVNAGYDFQADAWVDNYLAAETRAGRFRLGQFKTPVGWEDGNTSTGNLTFLERSLPEQAVYEGRRVGIDWVYQGLPQWLFQVGFFTRHDLNDDAAGRTFAGRLVYNPPLAGHDVVHLGLSASRELRDDRTGRIRARPEVNLTPVRLIDTGTLEGVDRLDRQGFEAAWIHGPLLLQGEALALQAIRPAARDFHSHGYYVSAAWALTGESRGYKAGSIGGITPRRAWGALELALRYATLDLDNGAVLGGREHDWTLGLNWYVNDHFKLQANLIRAFSDRGNLALDPTIYAMRAQLSF